MAGNTCEPRTFGVNHSFAARPPIHKAGINDQTAACAKVRMKKRGTKAVVERQNSHHAVTIGKLKTLDDGFGVRDDVAVGDHHAPGPAGGAGVNINAARSSCSVAGNVTL